MKKITSLKKLSLLICLFCAVGFGFGQSQVIISQYIDTDMGTTPKGIEIFNISGVDITFSATNNLRVYQGTNGAACVVIPGINIITGTLRANEVWVIGRVELTDYAIANGKNLSSTSFFNFAFNGDDALQVYLGGVLQDAFGSCGSDPGTSWTGGGVSTADNNLQIIDGLCSGNTLGWSDPSTRFTQIANGSTMTGFGDAPSACCLNSSTWTAGGWSPTAPTINTSVTIDFDYDTSINSSFSACSLAVNTGFDLTVANGDYVEVENDVIADGGITVETQGNFIQNNDLATFTDNSGGLVLVSKEKIMQKWYSYTYWSSPTATETIEGVLSLAPIDRRFKFVAANFIDILAEIGNTNTFTSGQDGIDDNGNDWQHATGLMVSGVGYAATANEFGPAFPRPAEKYSFYGEFNTGEITVPLVSNSLGAYEDWNLVGNPYPCAISADQLFSENSGLFDAIYLWDQGTPPSSNAGGSQGSNFSNDDYAIINGSGSVAGSRANSGIPPNRYVASGQGFFVDANFAADLVFNNSMRAITNDNSQFFKSANVKGKTSNQANRLWVNLTSDNGFFNQIMVGYINGATNSNDGAFYDTQRVLSSANSTTLYTTIENDNGKFAIQGKEVNSLDENEIISLGFKSTINVATLFTLSVAQLEGDFLNSNTIFLKDNLLNKTHNLSASDYTFTSAVGEFNNRFEIAFSNQALAVEDVLLNKNTLKIVPLENDYVQFKTSNNLSIKSVQIYDMLGRQLYSFKGETTSETYKLSNLNSSIFIAKVTLSNGAVISKKAFKK